MKVDVYWHSRRRDFSIRYRGRVMDHVDSVTLADAVFIVQENARQRVLTDRRKSVHAWITGTVVGGTVDTAGLIRVRYDPYQAGYFMRSDDGSPVYAAQCVVMRTHNGKASVWIG